jgi:curved DNA-binding protein CbpA
MGSAQPEVNYYDLFQINSSADAETVERVYRLLAARFHPDNPKTGDVERFHQITEAYRTLRDPEKRKEYDQRLESSQVGPLPIFLEKEFTDGIDAEAKLRVGVLCLLYNKRRSNPDNAALSLLDLEEIMAFPREGLLFALWYLRAKQFVVQDDTSSLIITAEGVDFLESQLPNNQMLYKIFRASQTGVMAYPKALPRP